MRLDRQRNLLAVIVLTCLAVLGGGCATTPPAAAPPAPPSAPVHAMVDVQKALETHPQRAALRQMEQQLAADEAKAANDTQAMETARKEFEAAMKVRENEDKAALEAHQAKLGDELSEQRRQYADALEAEYRPLLFNIDLKLNTVQGTPAEKELLQKDRDRLETERRQKLKAREDELAARFQKEMDAFAAELSRKAEEYANQWMAERMQRLQQQAVSPEREKQRQAIVDLSERMIQDVRSAVAKIALQEKIEVVWLSKAVHKPLRDITDLVTRELANVK